MIFYLNKYGYKPDENYWCIEILQQPFELFFISHFIKQRAVYTLRIGLPLRWKFVSNKY